MQVGFLHVPTFSPKSHGDNYYYHLLMLYLPWQDERRDLYLLSTPQPGSPSLQTRTDFALQTRTLTLPTLLTRYSEPCRTLKLSMSTGMQSMPCWLPVQLRPTLRSMTRAPDPSGSCLWPGAVPWPASYHHSRSGRGEDNTASGNIDNNFFDDLHDGTTCHDGCRVCRQGHQPQWVLPIWQSWSRHVCSTTAIWAP